MTPRLPQREVFHSICNPIRMRNIDSPATTPCARRVQGTQNRALSVVAAARIPSKSQPINARAGTNPVGRESPQYCPTSQRKPAHA
jgi:hypothetical protein